MLVLGIDPGTATTGYGLLAFEHGRMRPIEFGTVRTSPRRSAEARLLLLYDGITAIIADHHPDAFAVERLFFKKNVTNALAVGQARGVALLAAAQCGLPVGEYTPAEVKQAVTGYGSADKRQVAYMVQRLLALADAPRPDDTADALAVAICHALASGVHTAFGVRA
ncbi:MAG TPA: crossover junction endodeoxyribonuclease RuvC [Limnochordia bacterium]|nr:crossover junction endodeoxyribonuclease RuvC [Limnochordia bacterium]